MKGLIIALIAIVALIGAGIIDGVIINNDLNNRVDAAHERGYTEGYTQGYAEGLQQGGEAGYQEGSKTGYQEGKNGYYGDNNDQGTDSYFTYNPTSDEVHAILIESKMNYAQDIHNYAETKGIRTAYVRCKIARQATEETLNIYELVAFETVDNGLIIIEPWSHKEVKVEVGQSYNELNGFPTSPYDDTITEIAIIW
jgi:hypothetical protein